MLAGKGKFCLNSFMDIVLFGMGAILVFGGIFGCVIPVLPGLAMAFAGLVLLSFTSYASFSATYLIALGVLVAIISVLDNLVPVFGSKLFGVSKHGIIGSLIGMFAGFFLFPPFGAIIGIMVGAIVGEYISGKKHRDAIRSGFVTFVLTLMMFATKLSLCAYIAYIFFNTWIEAIDLPRIFG